MCFFDLLGRQAMRCSRGPPPAAALGDARVRGGGRPRRGVSFAMEFLWEGSGDGCSRGLGCVCAGDGGGLWVLLGVSGLWGVEEDTRGGDWGYRDALDQVFKAFKGEKRPV